MKKKLVPAYNCSFHLAKGGIWTIYPTEDFTMTDFYKTYYLAILHAKRKKLKKPVKQNRFWKHIVPTLEAVA